MELISDLDSVYWTISDITSIWFAIKSLFMGIIGTTQHLGVNCGTQRSDKVENSHNSCYNSGETLKDEGVSMATTSTQNGSLTS